MKSLKEYFELNESSFSNDRYSYHGTFVYVKPLLQDIIDGKKIPMGTHGDEGFLDIKRLNTKDKKELSEFLDRIQNTTVEEFNELISKFLNKPWKSRKSIWTSIFKGTYTGYVKGLSSKNKGNLFEDEFLKKWKGVFEPRFKKYLPNNTRTVAEPVGAQNNKRKINITADSISNFKGNNDIGDVVSDITIHELNNDNTIGDDLLYLSLKCGSTNSFISLGMTPIFGEKVMKDYETYDDIPKNSSTRALIDMLGLNWETMRSVFIDFGNDKQFEPVNVTDTLKKDGLFQQFMENIIGYGYLLVHAKNPTDDEVTVIDLRDENAMKRLIKGIKDATIYYGGKTGKGARISIVVEFENMDVTIVFRSASGNFWIDKMLCEPHFK